MVGKGVLVVSEAPQETKVMAINPPAANNKKVRKSFWKEIFIGSSIKGLGFMQLKGVRGCVAPKGLKPIASIPCFEDINSEKDAGRLPGATIIRYGFLDDFPPLLGWQVGSMMPPI
jgi:hypothetical protein